MEIINNFCKSRNLKLIDISHLSFKKMFEMVKKTIYKSNVILIIDIDKCSNKSKYVLEDIDQQKLDDYNKIIYKGKSLSLPHIKITDKILNRWFDELNEDNSNCSICLEKCKDSIVCPICMSMFCQECLEKYNKNECPVCKSGVL